jgi:hypothetical protein
MSPPPRASHFRAGCGLIIDLLLAWLLLYLLVSALIDLVIRFLPFL